MKSLSETYTKKELRHIADTLKELAREHPNVRQRHETLNALRVSVEFDPARNEYRSHIGSAQGHPAKTEIVAWGAALGAQDAEMVMPREYTSHGVVYYAPGFKWSADARPSPPTVPQNAARAHAPVKAERASNVLQQEFVA